MAKKFNYTGTCIPDTHFMVDISLKLEQIMKLIHEGEYFCINRPRQYGKSTTMNLLEVELEQKDYLPILISFEGIGDRAFENEESFSGIFIRLCAHILNYSDKEPAEYLLKAGAHVENLEHLSEALTDFIVKSNKKVVLMIDEVDKSSNNQLFVSFLAMLRDKYLLRKRGKGAAFHSVVLAGVHDVKTLKLKLRPDEEKKYNSPWNIAVDFTIDLAFSPEEIQTMLHQYTVERGVHMDIPQIARRLYHFTSGYPFLVSKLCYIIDSVIMPDNESSWTLEYVDQAVDRIIREENTNFDSLIKNLENNKALYDLVENILLKDVIPGYNIHNPLIKQGTTYGIMDQKGGKTVIHNKIYQEVLYNYMASKIETAHLTAQPVGAVAGFIKKDNSLDTGYLVIFDFRKEVDYKNEWVTVQGKKIYCVWC